MIYLQKRHADDIYSLLRAHEAEAQYSVCFGVQSAFVCFDLFWSASTILSRFAL